MNQRDAAWCLLIEFTQSESLRKHALAVEACMRAYARKAAADEELWGMVGLLHDFDYEKYPSADDHPYKGSEILKERGYSESFPWARRARRRCTGRATGWRGALPRQRQVTSFSSPSLAFRSVQKSAIACKWQRRPDRSPRLESGSHCRPDSAMCRHSPQTTA
jgi:putative nucleotidyltransferase with HDIG domain